MDKNYNDIINMPRHVSTKHKPMSMINRAAQFSPFAALTGYDDAVSETARLTSERIDLDESEIEELNRKLQVIQKNISSQPLIKITYFKADERKSGGSYITFTGAVKKLDDYEKCANFVDGTTIPFEDICAIEIKEMRGQDNDN